MEEFYSIFLEKHGIGKNKQSRDRETVGDTGNVDQAVPTTSTEW